MRYSNSAILLISTAVFLLFPLAAYAHGFGKRVDLPLPFNMYLLGGALAVGISFLLISFLPRNLNWNKNSKNNNKIATPVLMRISDITHHIINIIHCKNMRWLFCGAKVFLVFSWIGLILAGLIGGDNPSKNILPTTVWVIFGVGGTFLAALFGNWWMQVHPMGILYSWIIPDDSYNNTFNTNNKDAINMPSYGSPLFLGIWIALVGFLCYRIIENVFPNAVNPKFLTGLLLLYSGVTLGGMVLFGKQSWLDWGDPFGVFFRLFGKCRTELLRLPNLSIGEVLFVLLMLATLAYDGLKLTKWWVAFIVKFNVMSFVSKFWHDLFSLIAVFFIFIFAYGIISCLISFVSKTKVSAIKAAKAFAYSLLPIAVAYEFAHYATLFLIDGQRTFSLISDPFGFGWNIFGTSGYQVNYQIINFVALWNFQVVLVVLGHIGGIISAHFVSLELFNARKSAIFSQIPILFLMIGYTVFSLWLLSQPLALE